MRQHLEIAIRAEDVGTRIDKILSRHLPSGSRRRAMELLRSGAARLNGRLVKPSATATEGDRLSVELDATGLVPADAESVKTPLERADLVVLDKPGAMPSAALRGGEVGTVANVLAYRYPETMGIGHRELEAGLIHRLDTGTSGLLVAARNRSAFEVLVGALRRGEIEKRYLAIVSARGLPGEGLIDEALVPAGKGGQRVRIASPEEKGAHATTTTWQKRRVVGDWALVELSAPHAYRHQIRAHLAWLGHPIAGDALYGGPAAGLPVERHALHASYVAWAGAEGTAGFEVTSDLPEDLAALVAP